MLIKECSALRFPEKQVIWGLFTHDESEKEKEKEKRYSSIIPIIHSVFLKIYSM